MPSDAVFIIAALTCIAILGFVRMRNNPTVMLVERLILCTTITAGVYYYITQLDHDIPLLSIENVFFVGLALALAMSCRFSQSRNFQVTPMDFLVLFAVLIVPNILGDALMTGNIGEIAAKSVMLYYAVEYLISQSRTSGWPIRAVTACVLALFTAKALWL